MAPTRPVLAGLDVGGTKIGFALGHADGTVLASDRIATDHEREPFDLLREAFERLESMRASKRIAEPIALGVACPGPLSYTERRLLEVPNMPRWQQFEIGGFLDEFASVPSRFMNDANASVLAEVYWGAASGADSAVFLTMSTGMGAGLFLGGRLYEGPLALAGEVGHLRLCDDGPVGFGKRGSVEGYLSGPGIVQVATAELCAFEQRGTRTRLADEEVTPQRVCELAVEGDAAALAVVDRCGEQLGRLCAWLVDLLNPDAIVLGTIGTAFFRLWEPRIRAVLAREALPRAANHVAIRPSGLTDRGAQTALAIAKRVLDDRSAD